MSQSKRNNFFPFLLKILFVDDTIILQVMEDNMARFFSDDFWGRVRQRMMDLGLSMTDLSRLSGLPYGSIYRQINGGLVPSKHEHLENIASVLGCSVDYLLTGEKKEDNTLSAELMELVTRYKILNEDQKKTVDVLISQFTKDNQAYAEVYLQLHSEKNI